MGRIRIHIGCAPVSLKKANNNLKKQTYGGTNETAACCSQCKSTSFSKDNEEKNPKLYGEFPYLLQENPSMLVFLNGML